MDYSFDNERPIYIQLVEKLRIAIISGYYAPGSRLPSVRDLAIALKVNPNTLQKALEKLEEEKIIYTERTNGKYVTSDNKIILKLKEETAKKETSNYLQSMNLIGINSSEAIKYIKDLGGNK